MEFCLIIKLHNHSNSFLMGFPNKSFDFFFFFFLFHCLVLLFVFVLPICSISQPYKNVTLGSSLSTATESEHNNDPSGSYWSSQSGDFALGFRQLGTTEGFLLAIWFDKIAQKTVIWSANRDGLVPRGSTVQLTSLGQLVVNDPGGNEIWTADSSSASNRSVSYGAMLDSGNFVLVANNSEILWQSFDHPTDTLLPSQSLIENKTLVARYSETNYKSGRFQLWMQHDGNLVLYAREFPYDIDSPAYWGSNTRSGFQVVFNHSGSIDLIDENNTLVRSLMPNYNSTQNVYHRAVLDSDGIFRQYVYLKSSNSSSLSSSSNWSKVSQVPDPANVCTMTNVGSGSDICGFNSYCRLENDGQSHSCLCPPGYVLIDSNDVLKGCEPNFVPHSCDRSLPDQTDTFQLVPLENTHFILFDYDVLLVNEDRCRSECLSDCFCVGAVFSPDNKCWKKKFPFSFGRNDPSFGGRTLIKVRRDNTSSIPNSLVEKHNNKTIIVVIGSVLLGSSVFLNFLLLLLTLLFCHRFNKKKSKVVLQEDPLILGVNLRIFGYEELNKATSGFIEKLGRGSFATVYKGVIIGSGDKDSNLVAIKKLDNVVQQGDQEFKAEVSAIARTNHKNLVRLLGFCNEGEHRMLVYEFMRNGSLADFLFGASKPNWYDRIPLVLGTARGLSYLHEECGTQIIHCDIKPQNILLDHSFTARIADFGLAKLLRQDQTRTVTAIRGTKGYVAPEWFRSLPITVKVDVYSFGILLLEIICCRRNFEEKVEDEGEMVLADWAYDCFKERKVEMLVENDEEAKTDLKRVKKFVMVAIWCIQEEPSLRPTIKKVVQMLEGAIEVSFPPDPSSFINTIS